MVLCDHHQANEERELSRILGRGVSLSRGDLCVFLSCGHLCPVGVFPYLSPCPVAVFVSVSRGVSVSLCPLSVCVPVPWGLSLSSWGLSPCPGASACLAGVTACLRVFAGRQRAGGTLQVLHISRASSVLR